MIANDITELAQCDIPAGAGHIKTDYFSNLIGNCPDMLTLKSRMERVKDINAPILILGESGTGKELIAAALHNISSRKAEKFCAVNCGAIPENLLESELFGYKKGAFTDAKTDKKGLFEVVGEGTLFLDEIGDMPILLQTKLLRVLQDRFYTPLGSSVPNVLRAGIVCATHRNLSNEVLENRFRQDFLFRINVVALTSPPLRSRGDDLYILINHFLKIFNQRYNKHIKFPEAQLLKEMRDYQWPGNVRELQNSIERAVILAPENCLERNDIFFSMQDEELFCEPVKNNQNSNQRALPLDFDKPMNEAKIMFERAYLSHHLENVHGNISDASRTMGRHRADIYRMLDKHGLNAHFFRGPRNVLSFQN